MIGLPHSRIACCTRSRMKIQADRNRVMDRLLADTMVKRGREAATGPNTTKDRGSKANRTGA